MFDLVFVWIWERFLKWGQILVGFDSNYNSGAAMSHTRAHGSGLVCAARCGPKGGAAGIGHQPVGCGVGVTWQPGRFLGYRT
jgi:hypothetical protein